MNWSPTLTLLAAPNTNTYTYICGFQRAKESK